MTSRSMRIALLTELRCWVWMGASIVATFGTTASTVAPWLAARPDYQWLFPRDHWAHEGYRTEWWYFTGHLSAVDDPTHLFGYQFTVFRVGLVPHKPNLESAWATGDMIMGHLALTDLPAGHHVFSEVLYRTTSFLGQFGAPGDSLIAWSRAPIGTNGIWTLQWNGEGFTFSALDERKELALRLTTRAGKPLVFHGPNGYSRKGKGETAASLYYSFTRLETEGMLRMGGEAFEVEGDSWMDKEFGSNQLDQNQSGWDWLSVQLFDDREIMVYRLRDGSGATDFAVGTLIGPDGAIRNLGSADWSLEASAGWKSPHTGAQYPAAWTLAIPAAQLWLAIEPAVPDQENVSQLVPELHYWEGAAMVYDRAGDAVGRAYVELTGYGTASRPAI